METLLGANELFTVTFLAFLTFAGQAIVRATERNIHLRWEPTYFITCCYKWGWPGLYEIHCPHEVPKPENATHWGTCHPDCQRSENSSAGLLPASSFKTSLCAGSVCAYVIGMYYLFNTFIKVPRG